jgi:ABC-type antimicrobial peptide transport system permease subunit
MLVAAIVGLISGVIPSYRASNLGIVDALRYIG